MVPWPREADACREYLQQHGQPDRVAFEVGWSDEVLPRLTGPPLDLVLVDGGHGFPAPILDWYYAASRLRQGGLVILDDLQLPQVRIGLHEFLDADPRWERVEETPSGRRTAGSRTGPSERSGEQQPFLGDPISA